MEGGGGDQSNAGMSPYGERRGEGEGCGLRTPVGDTPTGPPPLPIHGLAGSWQDYRDSGLSGLQGKSWKEREGSRGLV